MPRRKEIKKRKILLDPKYDSEILTKFINILMIDGKRSVAANIVYQALYLFYKSVDKISDTINNSTSLEKTILTYFKKVIENVRPSLEVRSRRVGGATYQIPVEIRVDRSITLAMRWIIKSARLRSEHGMISRLSNELCDAYNKKGSSIKKREDTHKMAHANKAFAHFRWN